MTTEEIINLAKEKLGRDITEQEAQDYINGNVALPDEALEIVSGGCNLHLPGPSIAFEPCPSCGSTNFYIVQITTMKFECKDCGRKWGDLSLPDYKDVGFKDVL